MSKLLASLLDAREPSFSLGLRRLEQTCGYPSADVRLTADVLQRAHNAMRELKLDPSDTTSKELYHALIQRLEQDEKRLRRHLSVGESAPLSELIPAVLKSLEQLKLPRSAWVVKNSVAKRLIQTVPPKNVMKQLGYRSVDSMLKREMPAAIIAASVSCEGNAWQARFYAKYKQLKPTDCEIRDVQLVLLNSKRWQQFFARQTALQRKLLIAVPELGSLVILPMEATVVPGAAVALFLSFVYHINKIRTLSAQVKLHQVKPQFGSHALDVWKSNSTAADALVHQSLKFDALQHYLANVSPALYPELFDPYLQAENLELTTPEKVLSSLDQKYAFWHDISPSGMSDHHGAVSLHALDAAVNYCNGLAFERRSMGYLRESLFQELMLRYLQTPKVLERVLGQMQTNPSSSFSLSEAVI